MKIRFLCAVAVLLSACGGKEPTQDLAPKAEAPAADESFVNEARAATNKLQIELKQTLTTAMQSGGAVEALSVCKVQAPELAAQVAAATGLSVRRVSARNRNPQNVPTPGQDAVLGYFEAHPAAKDTVIVDAGRATYLRAIRVGADLCLQCHGDPAHLADDVKAELAQLYPQDKATGFARGDLRGAFVVTRLSASTE